MGDGLSTLQTLDRGLQALTIVATQGGLSIASLSTRLGVARANCYRIVTTLERHGMVIRGLDGHVRLGGGVAALAEHYWPELLTRAESRLKELAESTGATGQMSVVEGDRGVVVLSVPPASESMRLTFRVGFRHPLVGAAGIAIAMPRAPRHDDPADLVRAREAGYAASVGALHAGVLAIAAPIRHPVGRYVPEACVGLIAVDGALDVAAVGPRVAAAAREIESGLP